MKFKLDENLSRHLKPCLSQLGFDVSTAADEDLLSQPDSVVAEAAQCEGRIVLTLDVDFADAKRFAPGTHSGIVVFRPPRLGPLAVNQFVEEFVRAHANSSIEGCLVVVEAKRVRVRRPHTEATELAHDLQFDVGFVEGGADFVHHLGDVFLRDLAAPAQAANTLDSRSDSASNMACF